MKQTVANYWHLGTYILEFIVYFSHCDLYLEIFTLHTPSHTYFRSFLAVVLSSLWGHWRLSLARHFCSVSFLFCCSFEQIYQTTLNF